MQFVAYFWSSNCLARCLAVARLGHPASLTAFPSGRLAMVAAERRVCQSVKYAANALIAMAIEFIWQTSPTPSPTRTCGSPPFCGLGPLCSNLKQLLWLKLDMCPALSLIVFPAQQFKR